MGLLNLQATVKRSPMKLAGHWQILIALLSATLLAVLLRTLGEAEWISSLISVCAFVGNLFMQALKMIIVPLVVSSVIAGIAGLGGVKGFGRLGLKTLGFYLFSSFLAVSIGLTVVNLIDPGLVNGEPNAIIKEAFSTQSEDTSDADKERVEAASERKGSDFTALFSKMFPPNIFAAAADNGQLLGLIVFSLLFAVAMTRLESGAVSTLQKLFEGINEVMILITRWIMALMPIGVFALIIPVVYNTGAELFVQMGSYFVTVLIALAIHCFIALPLVLHFLAKINPWAHFRAMREALLIAFSTASSSATLPVTMRNVQDGSGVSKRTASFTLPLGATVNMDGTALYECVAVIFVAQVMGVQLDLFAQVMVVVTALLTSIGVAGIPSASLVAILLILKSSEIPQAETAVIALLAVDRLLDMSRTAVNVFSDSCAAVFIARSEGESTNLAR